MAVGYGAAAGGMAAGKGIDLMGNQIMSAASNIQRKSLARKQWNRQLFLIQNQYGLAAESARQAGFNPLLAIANPIHAGSVPSAGGVGTGGVGATGGNFMDVGSAMGLRREQRKTQREVQGHTRELRRKTREDRLMQKALRHRLNELLPIEIAEGIARRNMTQQQGDWYSQQKHTGYANERLINLQRKRDLIAYERDTLAMPSARARGEIDRSTLGQWGLKTGRALDIWIGNRLRNMLGGIRK